MPEDNQPIAKGSGDAATPAPKSNAAAANVAVVAPEDGAHYEEIAEYRIGEGPPPVALVVMFVLIVAWASLSWIPFFGY